MFILATGIFRLISTEQSQWLAIAGKQVEELILEFSQTRPFDDAYLYMSDKVYYDTVRRL